MGIDNRLYPLVNHSNFITKMVVKINALEVASTLAHQATYDEQKDIIADESDLFIGENYKEEHQDVFNRWYDYFFEILTNANEEDSTEKDRFPITHLTKDDLEHIGYDTKEVDENTMEQLASKLGDDYCEQMYWISLPIIADHLNIPKKPTPKEDDKD